MIGCCFALLLGTAPLSSSRIVSTPAPAAKLGAEDWSAIRAGHAAARRAVVAVESGHVARNDGQALTATFDGCGFTAVPRSADWTWGLELSSYGFAGEERAVAGPARVHADGERVAYAWDESLEEWYV